MTKGLCPFAEHRLIEPGDSDPRIVPRVAVLHVDAGNAASLYDYFDGPSGGIESHFHIRRDGHIEQYRNIFFEADANYHANPFAVSIETQGYGVGEWTPEQLASIKRLLLWLNAEADIPLRRCPEWDGSGVGYHVMFGAPGQWTPHAKSCPGYDRIRQFYKALVPWMESNPQEDEVPLSDNDIERIATAVRKELQGGEQARFRRLRKIIRGERRESKEGA